VKKERKRKVCVSGEKRRENKEKKSVEKKKRG
jgi:hypothetical protein